MEAKKIAETVVEYLLPQFRELSSRMDRVEVRVEEMGKRIDDLSRGLNARMDDLSREQQNVHARLNGIDQRLDNLYQVVVRRDEHFDLEARVKRLEEKVAA